MSCENHPAASPISPSSLKQKLKSSLRLPWLCHNIRLRRHHHQQFIALSASTSTPLPTPSPSPAANNHSKSRLSRTSYSTWFKSPEFKDKYRDLISRIGYGPGHNRSHSHSHGHGHHHGQGRRRRHSADFRYDPASYALNFDEGCDDSQLDEFPFRNFSARLPPSPTATSSRETTAYKL